MAQITARRYHRFRNSLCDSKTPLRKKWPDMKMSYFHTLLAKVCTGVAPEVNAKVLAWENSTITTPKPCLSLLPA